VWEYNKSSGIYVIRVPEEQERENIAEIVLKEIMAERFLNMARS
jgi:hypothetical protein